MFKQITIFICLIIVLSTSYVFAEEYVWTGAAHDGLWNNAGNWDTGKVPTHDSGAVSIVFFENNPGLVITVPEGYTADCTFGDDYGTLYAPAFGMHLDIYGSLTYKWYLAAGQTNPAGQRSVINMYNGSSIYGAEGIAIGDNWWLPGPYVTMNMYGTATADINWLWLGGHLNMYGGTMDVSQGVAMCPNVDDALTRVDIYAGKLILPGDVTETVINDWISRGILLSYGHKPGTDGYEIVVDKTTMPGRTIITATAADKTLAETYRLEKSNEAALWSQMALVVSNIEQERDSETEEIKNKMITDFSSNPRLPEALIYIAQMYESAGVYDKAGAIYQQVAQQFSESPRSQDIQFALGKLHTLALIDSGDKDALSALDNFTATFQSRPDVSSVLVSSVTERLYDKAFKMEAAGLKNQSRAYFQKTVDIWEQVNSSQTKLINTADRINLAGNCYRKLGQFKKAIDCYKDIAENFPEYELAWNCLFRVGRCYEDMTEAGLISAEKAEPEIMTAYQQLIEKYPDCAAVRIAKDWLYENQREAKDTIFEE